MSEASVDQFLNECGWSGPLELELESLDGSSNEVRRELRQPFVVVGRRESADLRFDHPDVSRSHAYLQVVAGQVFCVDLQSRTGIHWGRVRQPWGWIEPGAAIRIGMNRIRPWGGLVRMRGGAGVTESPPISGSFGTPGGKDKDAVLELLGAGDHPFAWNVNSAILLLGRSPLCKVHLPSSLCATVHASLVRTPAGVWLVDLCSTNGTFVNGASVRCAKLADGDDLTLGPFPFRFHQGAAATRILRDSALPGEHQLACSESGQATPGRQGQDLSDANLESIPGQDSLVVEFLRGIGRQQMETNEQFRQILGLFYQMHQEQMNLVRDEVRRLGRLAEAHFALQDSLAHQPPARDRPLAVDRRAQSPSRPPHPSAGSATVAKSARVPEKRANQTRSRKLPASASRPGVSFNSTDPVGGGGGVHLAIAQRLTTCRRNDQGRLRRILGWLSRSIRASSAS